MMECTGQKFGQLEGWKTASLKFGLLDYFFFFSFSQMGATLVLREKNKHYLTHNASQSQDGGVLEDLFAVYPETFVALDTANLVTFLFQKSGKKAQNLS